MKNAIIGTTFIWVFLLGTLILLSMSEQSIRRIYLEHTLSAVMEDSMLKEQSLRDHEENKVSEEEVRKLSFMNRFLTSMEERMQGKQQLNIRLIGLDLEKGIMSVEVESTFLYPTGEKGRIVVYRTIILETHGKRAAAAALFLTDQSYKIHQESSCIIFQHDFYSCFRL